MSILYDLSSISLLPTPYFQLPTSYFLLPTTYNILTTHRLKNSSLSKSRIYILTSKISRLTSNFNFNPLFFSIAEKKQKARLTRKTAENATVTAATAQKNSLRSNSFWALAQRCHLDFQNFSRRPGFMLYNNSPLQTDELKSHHFPSLESILYHLNSLPTPHSPLPTSYNIQYTTYNILPTPSTL